MMQLFHDEIRRALKGPWFIGSLALLTVLAIVSAATQIGVYINGWKWIIEQFSDEGYYFHTIYSCFNQWLPMSGPTEDASSLFFTLTPLLVLMVYAWSLAADVRSGYVAQLVTRASRRRFYAARYGATFVSAGLLAIIPLIMNLVLLACVFPAYTPSVVDRMYIPLAPGEAFASLFFSKPLLYVILRCFLNFVLCGLWAVLVLGFSTLTTNRIALVSLPFIALLLVKHVGENVYVMMRERGYEHFGTSITLFDQLRAGGINFNCYLWVTCICAVLMLAASLAIPYMRRKADIL